MAKSNKGGNRYDRILKENTSALVLRYLAEHWSLDLSKVEAMPTKYSRTLEREVDYLYRVPNEEGRWIMLHLEFQTTNNSEMLECMQEYQGILYRRYRLLIKHVLIYLGKSEMRMSSQLPEVDWFKAFETISLRDMDVNKLLTSQVPEVLILAILAQPGTEPPEKVLRLIIDKLHRLVDHPEKRRKYFTQLLIMSSLRKPYRVALEKIRMEMPIELDIIPEEDFVYKLAVEEYKAKFEEFKREAEQAKREAEEVKREVKREAEQAERKRIIEVFKAGIEKQKIASIFGYSLEDLEALLAENGLNSQK